MELDKRRFYPTDVGRIVNRFLTQHFPRYVDYDFTARMEDELDAISRGEEEWVPLMDRILAAVQGLVDEKTETVSRARRPLRRANWVPIPPAAGRSPCAWARFGPFVQIGTKDDDEKPRFAGLKPDQRMDTITMDEALALFRLPRELGDTAEGEPVSANIGRFGPYVRYGNKFVSLKEGDDPYSITLERALELVAEHKAAAASKVIKHFDGSDVQVLRGRFGPYITDGTKNAKVPKDREPDSLELAECRELLAAAPARKSRRRAVRKTAS